MSKARIMVVEDEGVVALQIKEALEGLGYAVPLVALSGEEGVEKVMETEPDLVLMDIQLKGALNGIEAAKQIRQRLDVPVVYLTAFSDTETLEQAQLTDPHGYVLKPFEERALHAILQMALSKHRRTRGAREEGWWMTAVAASMAEAVVISDAKGYVKFINPAAETLVGKRQPDVVEKRLLDVVTLVEAETGAPFPFPVSEPLLEGKSVIRGNCRLVSAAGPGMPVEFSASPLRSPEGTLFGILYLFRQTTSGERIQHLALRELEALAAVQKKALPARDASIGGFRFDRLFRPAASGGGDTMGFFRLDQERVAFYSLEVFGGSALSSFFSLLLRAFLSPDADMGGALVELREEKPRPRGPSEVVGELNRRFFLKDDTRPLFTFAYGIAETGTGAIRLARAGHPYPLHQKADGTVRAVKPEGYAVGLFPSAETASEELLLEKGDRLFVYSDGLVDCTNPSGERFSSTRLVDFLTASRAKPMRELIDSLGQEIAGWRESETFEDDVSLLAIEKE